MGVNDFGKINTQKGAFLRMGRQKLGEASISDLRILACGFSLKQYPRVDMLWKGLSRLDVDKLIDLRHVHDFLDRYQDSVKNRQRSEHVFHKITREIYSHRYSFFNFFKYVIFILQTIRKEKIDIVFVFPKNRLLAICLALLRFHHGANVYLDLHVSGYSAATSGSICIFRVAWRGIIEFLSIKLANRLICLTSGYVQYFSKVYKTRADKFSVVPDGIQDIWLEGPVSAGRARNPEVNPPTRVLYWGMFLIQHGLEEVINAAEELKDEKIEFIFCGSGKREKALKEQAKEKKLSNVTFKGFIPTTEELIRLVDSADICLGFFKDTHDASFTIPIKVQQGMARGKPVITLWNKCMEDLYRTRDNLFPPLILINPDSKSLANAISEVIKDRQKAEKIGDAARLTVERVHGVEAVTSALKESLERAF